MTKTEALLRHSELAGFIGECPSDDPGALRRIRAIAAEFLADDGCSHDVRLTARNSTTWLAIWCGPGQWLESDMMRIRASLSESLRGLEAAIQAGCADP